MRDRAAHASVTNAASTPPIAGSATSARFFLFPLSDGRSPTSRPAADASAESGVSAVAAGAAGTRAGANLRQTRATRMRASHTSAAVMSEYPTSTAPSSHPARPATAKVTAGPDASAHPARSPPTQPSRAPGSTSRATKIRTGQIKVMRLLGRGSATETVETAPCFGPLA